MDKPKPKREVAINYVHRCINAIVFYASTDAVEDLRELGEILGSGPNQWRLIVDARYDFDEVVAYIENY